jgi:hypothetical protein
MSITNTTPYITLAQVKARLPNSYNGADDTGLNRMIAESSAFLDTYCNRANNGFNVQTYDEIYNGTGERLLFLNNTPIQSIQKIATVQLPTLSIQNNDTDVSARATVSVVGTPANPINLNSQYTSTGLTLFYLKNNVPITNVTLTWEEYPTIASLAAAINALGNNWQCTVQGNFGGWSTTDLRATQGSFGCRTTTAYLWIHWYELPYYRIDENTGEIYSTMGFSRGWGNWRIIYTAGNTVFPLELAGALAELVVNAYMAKSQNSNLQSQSTGPTSYTQFVEKGFEGLSIASCKTINRYKIRKVSQFSLW